MINQRQSQKQQIKILPQQIKLLNLFFLNSVELEQRIDKELDENPLLELEDQPSEIEDYASKETENDYKGWDDVFNEDVPNYKTEYSNYFAEEEAPNVPLRAFESFRDEAKKQIVFWGLNDEDLNLAYYIIDSLSHHGILDKPLEALAEDYSFYNQRLIDTEQVENVLKVVQQLEPLGIGARSIQECLLLQLYQIDKNLPHCNLALRLVQKHYNDLMNRQFEKIKSSLHIQDDILKKVLNLIGTLKFHPVTESESSSRAINTIVPDYLIKNEGGKIQVALYTHKSNNISVNQNLYNDWYKECQTSDRTAVSYIKNKMLNAQWFVNSIKQREETMLAIMKCIVMLQQPYFLEGDIRMLKPMVLRNVSDLTGYDISTVSRITGNKHAETHFGLVFLKDLFSEGIANKKGKVISNKVIQSVIAEAIAEESKSAPYTDMQLVNILEKKGYNIARRTVAKYREALKIPIAQIRAIVK